MTQLWLVGNATAVPPSEDEVRSTIEPIRDDGPSEQTHAPEWNEFYPDASAQLVGLSPRQRASDTHDSDQYIPFWIDAEGFNHNVIIDNQVSSSGTAAKREEAGHVGHGVMQYAEGIEPVLRDGNAYGTDYFTANILGANEGSGNYMTPAVQDDWLQAVAQRRATERTHDAFMSTMYQNMWSA